MDPMTWPGHALGAPPAPAPRDHDAELRALAPDLREWLRPLAVGGVAVGLSGALRPGPVVDELPAPATLAERLRADVYPVSVSVGAAYLVYDPPLLSVVSAHLEHAIRDRSRRLTARLLVDCPLDQAVCLAEHDHDPGGTRRPPDCCGPADAVDPG